MDIETYGNVGGFKESEESWTQYAERLEQYFMVNEINDEKKQRTVMFYATENNNFIRVTDAGHVTCALHNISQPKKRSVTEL